MPHRSRQYRRHNRSDQADTPPQAGTAAQRLRPADFALMHGGRQIRLGPIAFWVTVGTLVLMGLWTITTATYFAFRDDVLTRLIARQAEMQFAYEDRIAELRSQIDRISSRQLLDQEQYEQKLEQMLRRQAALESRAAMLDALPDPAPTGSIRKPAGNAADEPARAGAPKPSPINDSVIFVAPPEREARMRSHLPAARRGSRSAPGVDGALAHLQRSLDQVEARQANVLNALETRYDSQLRRIRTVLIDLGMDAAKLAPAAGSQRGTGGPYVPARSRQDASPFERQLQRVSLARAQVERMNRTLVTVPIRRPLADDTETSSSFGVRLDPFTRSPAMHTGLDFRADSGDPVQATANGTVTIAGWNGGYGRMVEIDHDNGFSTRYAHLSSVAVKVGQKVKAGQLIGRVGSTGRSTGPHLHYETRVEGDAINPLKFLRAGARLNAN